MRRAAARHWRFRLTAGAMGVLTDAAASVNTGLAPVAGLLLPLMGGAILRRRPPSGNGKHTPKKQNKQPLQVQLTSEKWP